MILILNFTWMTETEKMPFLCVRFRLLRIDLVGRHPFDFQQSACGSAPHGSFMPLPNRLASLQTDSSVLPLRVKETNRRYNRHRVTFTMARTAAVPQPLPENSRVERDGVPQAALRSAARRSSRLKLSVESSAAWTSTPSGTAGAATAGRSTWPGA